MEKEYKEISMAELLYGGRGVKISGKVPTTVHAGDFGKVVERIRYIWEEYEEKQVEGYVTLTVGCYVEKELAESKGIDVEEGKKYQYVATKKHKIKTIEELIKVLNYNKEMLITEGETVHNHKGKNFSDEELKEGKILSRLNIGVTEKEPLGYNAQLRTKYDSKDIEKLKENVSNNFYRVVKYTDGFEEVERKNGKVEELPVEKIVTKDAETSVVVKLDTGELITIFGNYLDGLKMLVEEGKKLETVIVRMYTKEARKLFRVELSGSGIEAYCGE